MIDRRRLLTLAFGLPIASGLAGCAVAPPPPGAFSAADQAALAQVQDYLDNARTLQARFLQTAADGRSTGTVWMARPGRLRLQYDPPSPLGLLVARGRVKLTDASTGGSSSLPLARTPLAILLADHVELSGAVTVVAVRHAPDGVAVVLRSTAHPGQGQITLDFSSAPFALRGVTLVDGHDNITQLSLRDVRVGVPVDDGLFGQAGA